MKQLLILVFFFSPLFTSFASCDKDANDSTNQNNSNINPTPRKSKMTITIGSRTFMTTLYDNAAVKAFELRLPMTIQMKELNGNEKFFDLPYCLPASASNPGTIKTGAIMLWIKHACTFL